jgi:hypothetical protein
MAKRVKLPKADPGLNVEIEVPGDRIYDYKAIPVTIDVEEALEELEGEIQRAEERDTTPLERVELQLRELDCILRPRDDAAGDPPEKVSELLLPAYEEKKVTAMAIRDLSLQVLTEIRPT